MQTLQPAHRILLAARQGVRFLAEVDAGADQAAEVDPIFSAIDCHQAAAKANRLAQARASARGNKVNEDASDKASDAESAAMAALIATVPTTAAGLHAGLEYVATNGFEGNDLVEFIRTLLHSLTEESHVD